MSGRNLLYLASGGPTPVLNASASAVLQHRNPDQVEAKVYFGFRERVEPGRGDVLGFKIVHPVVGVVRAAGREVDCDQTAKVRIVDVSGQVWLGTEPGGETVGRVDGIAFAAHGHLEVGSEGSAEIGFAHADEAGCRQDHGAGVGDPVNRVLTDLTGIQRTSAGVGCDVAQVFPEAASLLVPLLQVVRDTQTVYRATGMLVPLHRGPGLPPEQRYFDFSYLPLAHVAERMLVEHGLLATGIATCMIMSTGA